MQPARRLAFVHEAVLTMPEDGDDHGPGGSITLALCGAFDHSPPCPLAPHQTDTHRSGGRLYLRTVFATEAGNEPEVRRRIDIALAARSQRGPDGTLTTWVVVSSGPGTLQPDERDLGVRLARS